jgi:hypothetical protein
MVFAFVVDWPKPWKNKRKQIKQNSTPWTSPPRAVHGVWHVAFLFLLFFQWFFCVGA